MFGISVEEEQRLVHEAQNGSQEALAQLIEAYQPALRNAVGRYKNFMEAEDCYQDAVEHFIEMVLDHDYSKSPRLAARKKDLDNALKDAVSKGASHWTIPPRTKQRFLTILRKAEGDVEVGMEICEDYAMPASTFLHIYNLMYGQVEYEDCYEQGAEAYVDAESRALVELGFTVLDDDEARIVELAYGFTSFEPVPDAEIAHRMGTNRTKVNRRRNEALSKMRERIGVA